MRTTFDQFSSTAVMMRLFSIRRKLHPHFCVHKEIKGNLIHSLPCMNIVFIKLMESKRVDQINKCIGSGSDHTEMHCCRRCCFKNTLEKLDSSKTIHLHLEPCAITVLTYVFTYIFVLKSVQFCSFQLCRSHTSELYEGEG